MLREGEASRRRTENRLNKNEPILPLTLSNTFTTQARALATEEPGPGISVLGTIENFGATQVKLVKFRNYVISEEEDRQVVGRCYFFI